MEMFEKASRQKLRFESNKGFLSTEDLWDLSLQSLDLIAKSVNKKLKEDSEESFIATKSKSNTELELKLEILKHVIQVKLQEADAAKTKAAKQAKIAQLKELAASKANEELSSKPLDEIQKMIEELEVEEA